MDNLRGVGIMVGPPACVAKRAGSILGCIALKTFTLFLPWTQTEREFSIPDVTSFLVLNIFFELPL